MSRRPDSRALASALTAAFLLGACGGGGEGFVNPPPPPPVVTVSISPTTTTVNVGATTSLAVAISGGSPTPTLASCSSSSPGTASVTTSGVSCVVVGVSPGLATITATTTGSQTATAVVTVAALPAAITELTLTPPTSSIVVGRTVALTATPTSPAGATVAVTYSTSSASVASVSVAGVVTAVSPGTATITATAVGGGVGLSPATIVRTALITVTADACAPLLATLPFNRNGTITTGSCVISPSTGRRGQVIEVNLANATAVELIMTPNGFAPYLAAFPQGEVDFIFRSRPVAEPVSGIWHLPSGRTEIRVGGLNSTGLGAFQLQGQQVSASVENCRSVVVAGSVTSNQALQDEDCLYSGFRADEFFVFSSRSCTITMSRSTANNSLADPLLEVYDGTTLVTSDDDSGGGANARISLPSCRTAANGVLQIRATSFEAGDVGAYAFSVLFGAAPGSASEAVPELAPSASNKPPRAAPAPPQGASGGAGSWLRYLGIGVETAAR